MVFTLSVSLPEIERVVREGRAAVRADKATFDGELHAGLAVVGERKSAVGRASLPVGTARILRRRSARSDRRRELFISHFRSFGVISRARRTTDGGRGHPEAKPGEKVTTALFTAKREDAVGTNVFVGTRKHVHGNRYDP